MGSGPLALFAHGFPEFWYSWRHQIDAVAAAGFHGAATATAIGPKRSTSTPCFIWSGDMVGILDALQAPRGVIIGHDWGASVAWQAALLRPDRARAVVTLRTPFHPRGGPAANCLRASAGPSRATCEPVAKR
jgi:pimeloyl-ACP methyl ester carboxylesterase